MKDRQKNAPAAVILAAGKGTRMKSDLAKVLHPLCGKPMIHYSVTLAQNIGAERIVVVVGHQADAIKTLMNGTGVLFADQEKQLGTAHAVLQSREALRHFTGTVVILCGDVPLLETATIAGLMERHYSRNAALTVLTAVLDHPGSYGRVVKEGDRVLRIVEARDADAEILNIREINTGIYCAESDFLFDALSRIDNDNAQGEYYFTDIFEIAARDGRGTSSFVIENPVEAMGINTVAELARADEIMKQKSVSRSDGR